MNGQNDIITRLQTDTDLILIAAVAYVLWRQTKDITLPLILAYVFLIK